MLKQIIAKKRSDSTIFIFKLTKRVKINSEKVDTPAPGSVL